MTSDTSTHEQQRLYQIPDVGLILESESEELPSLFEQDYSRFSVSTLPPGRNLAIRLQSGSDLRGPSLRIGDADLCALLRGVSCYRLSPGRFDRVGELVLRTLGPG